MKQYLDHVKRVLNEGVSVSDRTGVGTRSVVGAFLNFNLQEGFPLVTAKQTDFAKLAQEMLWFLSGSPYITPLKAAKNNIWNNWAVDESIDFPKNPAKLLELMLKAQSLPGYLATYKRTADELKAALTDIAAANYDLKILGLCREMFRFLKMAGHTGIYEKVAVTEIEQRLYQAFLECDDQNAIEVLTKALELGEYTAQSLGDLLTQMGAAPYISRFHDSLGPIYGVQWRHWQGAPIGVKSNPVISGGARSFSVSMSEIDQIDELMKGLDAKPYSRRHIVTAWDPRFLPDETKSPQENVREDKMALAPCHKDFQVVLHEATLAQRKAALRRIYPVDADYAAAMSDYPASESEATQHSWLTLHNVPVKALYLHLNLRSSDTFLGLPYNIAQYALLAELIAMTKGHLAVQLSVAIVDAHLYSNHLDLAGELVLRQTYSLPRLKIMRRRENLWDYEMSDLDLVGYESGPRMLAPVAV